MKRVISLDDLKNSACARLNPQLFGTPAAEPKPEEPKRSKFGNQITMVDGIPFDSNKEAKRFRVLRTAMKSGEISFLARQVEFELNPGGTHSLVYVADFTYTTKDGKKVVEDCKGWQTPEYKKKRRLMLKVHGIRILET